MRWSRPPNPTRQRACRLSISSGGACIWADWGASRATISMRVARTFVDTNVLVYPHNLDASSKHKMAKRRIVDLWESERGVVSIQVLQEFYVTITRKISHPVSRAVARQLVRSYAPWLGEPIDSERLLRASEIEELHKLSFWDALIVAAAARAGAKVLLSEDFSDGQVIEGVKIENPFRTV